MKCNLAVTLCPLSKVCVSLGRVFRPSVIMPVVIRLSVIMQIIIIPNVINPEVSSIACDIMPSVMAPTRFNKVFYNVEVQAYLKV